MQMTGKPKPTKWVNTRVQIGYAWIKQGAKVGNYPSGYITPEAIEHLYFRAKRTGKRINFYILPNAKRKFQPDAPPYVVFAVYWAAVK
jgi:hypothetical protein